MIRKAPFWEADQVDDIDADSDIDDDFDDLVLKDEFEEEDVELGGESDWASDEEVADDLSLEPSPRIPALSEDEDEEGDEDDDEDCKSFGRRSSRVKGVRVPRLRPCDCLCLFLLRSPGFDTSDAS